MGNHRQASSTGVQTLLWIGSAIGLATLISVWIFNTHHATGHPGTHLLKDEWTRSEDRQEKFRDEVRRDIKHILTKLSESES